MARAIDQFLAAIRQAIYGRDVREAIASGIEQCYEDSTASAQKADIEAKGAEVLASIPDTYENLNGAVRSSRLAFEPGWMMANNITKNGTFYHLKYIPCTPGETFIVHNALTDNQYAFAVLFFGIDGLYLSGVGKNVGGDTLNVTVPENAYFFGINKKTETTNCWVEYDEVNYKPVETVLKSQVDLLRNQVDSALSLKQSKNRTQLDAYWIPGYFSRGTFFPKFGSDAYNFRHIIIYLNKSFDLVFSEADTSNQYVDYLFFMDSAFNAITSGKRTNTGNTEDTVLAADFPTGAVYAVITYKTAKIANAQIKNGPSAFDTYFVDPYMATRSLYSSGLIKQEAYSWRGWIGHDDDINYERIIVKLKKDANLVFTGADTNNQYFYYLKFVDAEGNYLTAGQRKQTGNTEDTVLVADYPTDAVYAVITYKRGQLKASTITNGSIVQFVPPNTFELLNNGGDEPVEPTAIAEIVIPSEITAVVGDTLQIYYDSIVKSIEPVKVEFVGTKGNALERYFEYTPTANDIGNSSMVINARKYDNLTSSYSTIVATKTITLKTIAVPISPSTEKHVLCVGDSTIVDGAYVKEIARRICGTGGTPAGNNLSNIKFTGRLNKTVDDIVVGYEGFSGWSWNSYISGATKAIRFYVSGVSSLNFEAVYQDSNGCRYNIAEINVAGGSGNIRCLYVMGSASTTPPTSGTLTRVSGSGDATIAYTNMEVEQFAPFIDNGQVTFVPYVTEYCGGSVDYVLFSLGTNVIVNSNAEFSTIKANMLSQMNTLISKLHEQYPAAIVLLCTLQKGSMNGGFGANFGTAYNASSEFYNHKVYELNQAYIEFASTRNYVKLVDVSAEFDTVYDYPHTMKNVNVRNSTEKELVDSNFGHPSTIGYMQMADAMYRALCGELAN